MNTDHYAGTGHRWATGAVLVYAPIVSDLVTMCPHPLAGRTVLDVGAGTGVANAALADAGAHPLAMDLSFDMLAWEARRRPPCAVADIRALPVADDSVDDSVAAFVLNHLVDPEAGFAELVRVTRPGGAVLAAVYSNESQSQVRDRVDELAAEAGWKMPDWYGRLKACTAPLLGSTGAMEAAAASAGLVDVVVEERAVDVGVTEATDLVRYRLGQAHFTGWLEKLGGQRADEVRRRIAVGIAPIMEPYRPIVVFLASRVAAAAGA